MYEADRPIVSSEQDRLGRVTFAKYLARSMLDHTNPESLVIGLFGGWGVGKTSLINLILEELRYAGSNMYDDERPIILNFSPWSYSGQNQLIYSFFRRLSSEIRQFPFIENAERIIYLLELYVSFFTHEPIPKALRVNQSSWSPFKNKETDEYGWESGKDLTLVKKELNELLLNQKHKIIIIIDNISRVEDKEINQIFQIVKSMGDYFNTIYLLALDKKQVIDAMLRLHGSDGEFLDKIIQLPFDIPPISSQDLEILLFDKLKKIIAIAPEDSWSAEYWADIYYGSLKYFFQNCRDITRYINTLGFSYSRVKELVNPVDYFAITALEVFEPYVYEGIRENKDLLSDLFLQVYPEDKLAEDKLRCDEIIKRARHIPAEKLKQLLIRLFPRLLAIYDADVPFYHSESVARKNKRICSSDLFEIYFRLSLASGSISETEFNALLAATSDLETFDHELSRLNHDERVTKFLSRLDGLDPNKIPNKNVVNIICGLIDNGDLIPEGESDAITFSTPMRIHRIIHQMLSRFEELMNPPQKELNTRYKIMCKAINHATKSLYIIVHELNVQSMQHAENDYSIPIEHRDFIPSELDALKNLAVERIQYWVKIGRLVEHPKLIPILRAWMEWGSEAECREYIESIVKNDKTFVLFLTAILKDPIDELLTNFVANPEWKNYVMVIDEFISSDKIINHAKELFEDGYFEKLREREQLALLIFLDIKGVRTLKDIPKTSV